MTDAAATEAPIEPVPPAPESALPTPAPPALDEPVASSAEAPAERALPEIEHAIGSTRQAILDYFVDSEGDQSMAQIKAALPNLLPGTIEACVRREWQQGRLVRVSPGVYRLAPPKPLKPPKPPPPQPEEEATWFEALERWVVDRSWDTEKLGPSPDRPNHRIPPDIVMRMNDRLRKREQRRKEAEAAAAKRAAADAELRDRLIAATGGNIVRGPAIEDVAPIRAALELVPVDRVVSAIRSRTDKKLYPGNEPATSWREPRLLKEIAENYCRTDIVPRLVDAWSKAGKAPAPTVPSSPPAGDPTDIERGHHDHPSASPGPHVVPQPDAAPAMPQEAASLNVLPEHIVSASEASPAVQVSPEPENESTEPPPAANPNDGPAIDAEPAAVDVEMPEARPTRASILAAFARNRTPPSPQPAVRQVERPPERQAEPISREGWEELVGGYVAGNVNWNVKRLGAPPGDPNCRAPRDLLRSFGL